MKNLIIILTVALGLFSCQKENVEPNNPNTNSTPNLAEFTLKCGVMENNSYSHNGNVRVVFMQIDPNDQLNATIITDTVTSSINYPPSVDDCSFYKVPMTQPAIEGTSYRLKIYQIGGMLLSELNFSISFDGQYYIINAYASSDTPGGYSSIGIPLVPSDCGGALQEFVFRVSV